MESVSKFLRSVALIALLALLPGRGLQAEFELIGDFLYWGAIQPDLSFGVVSSSTNSKSETLYQNWQWGPGFRVGLAGRCTQLWDARADWTYYHNSHTTTRSVDFPAYFITASQLEDFSNLGGIIGPSVTSSWKVHLDMFQVDAGFPVVESCCFWLHPYIGLKGGWIHQKQTILYDNYIVTGGSGATANGSVTQTNNMWALGPLVGCDTAYGLCQGLDLVANFNAAFLVGQLNGPTDVFLIEAAGGVVSASSSAIRADLHTCSFPAMRLLIGLDWKTVLQERFLLSLGLGYEAQIFWNVWRTHDSRLQDTIATTVGMSDLVLQGLTAHVGIGF